MVIIIKIRPGIPVDTDMAVVTDTTPAPLLRLLLPGVETMTVGLSHLPEVDTGVVTEAAQVETMTVASLLPVAATALPGIRIQEPAREIRPHVLLPNLRIRQLIRLKKTPDRLISTGSAKTPAR